MFYKKTIKDIEVNGKKVLIRVDFNVPIKDGQVGDDTRMQAALPTIKYLLEQGAALVLCSHLGRPKGKPLPEFSLRPVADHLRKLIPNPVYFSADCVGELAEKAAEKLKAGEVLLLENTRFHEGETKNDANMAKLLASLADIYVNDAFGSAHRAHASTEGVTKYLPAVAGFLMEKEIMYLGEAIANPKPPFVAILGGAKISDKIGVIRNLLKKADYVIIGGGMANTFLKASNLSVGDSLVEDEALETAKELLTEGDSKLQLPVDFIIADRFEADANFKSINSGAIPDGWRILDIGNQTVVAFTKVIQTAGTIVWNGPMGVFEFPKFAEGTFSIARAVSESNAISIVGGGDSIAAIKKSGLSEKITHISTGGGASLEMLEGLELPGVAALQDR